MIQLILATDKLQVVTGTAADVDVVASWTDLEVGTTNVTPGKTLTAITTATTTDIVPVPGSGLSKRIHFISIRNKDTADSTTVTVVFDANGTDYEMHKATLAPGDLLEYSEATGFFLVRATERLDVMLVTTADVINATTSWADITGLTYPIKAGKTYIFEAAILYINNATTTGARFGVNGPALTYLRGGGFGTVTGSVTAAALSTPTAAVSAVDTSMIGAQTTGPATEVCALVEGTIIPSADGTFAMRSQSEVAVAAGVTMRRGSRLHLREASNT